jgi:hypothetical protein
MPAFNRRKHDSFLGTALPTQKNQSTIFRRESLTQPGREAFIDQHHWNGGSGIKN